MLFINQEVIDILQYRIQQEQYASKVYEQMSLFLQNESYLNMAKVWSKFSKEELEHAELAKKYLLSFNVMPELMSVEEPMNDFKDAKDVIQKTFDLEVKTTNQVKELSDKAMELKDWSLFNLAQEYTEIQIHEMNEVYDLVDIAKLTNDNLILDKYIGENF
jgi:ferritin